ncbi:MAG: hypothetical protein EA344_06150 [Alkalicoccus sp.]|nr:MAG: hypothetical protein EA344_06150 [Alkalicoccus sp.]
MWKEILLPGPQKVKEISGKLEESPLSSPLRPGDFFRGNTGQNVYCCQDKGKVQWFNPSIFKNRGGIIIE